MRYIDLRSDTVTQPTEDMRKAMANAPVGDDVYGDDPTVNELERLAAEVLGKEAALFVPSGTMGNQLCIMAQTKRGDEVIVSDESHIFVHEVGAAAVLSAVTLRQVQFENGIFSAAKMERAIREEDIHEPPTTLLCMENALSNGRVVPLSVMEEVYAMAKRHNLRVHLDGARVFNAAVALGVDVTALTQYTDTVSCCLSKGLCAPVGSVIAGDAAFIGRARKCRKLLGGGMRQAGILAAAGILALTQMPKRLHIDHENAKYLAEQLKKIPGVTVDVDAVDINMVFLQVEREARVLEAVQGKLLESGVKINGVWDGNFRFVTSNDVSRADIDTAIAAFSRAIG